MIEDSAETHKCALSINFPFFIDFPYCSRTPNTDSTFFTSFSSSKFASSPTRRWVIPARLSILKGILLTADWIAWGISLVSVPFLTVGIKPSGPKYLAIFVNTGIICGVAMHRLNLSLPLIMSCTSSAPPAICAPDFNAISIMSGGAKTRTWASVFMLFGRLIIPRIPFEL